MRSIELKIDTGKYYPGFPNSFIEAARRTGYCPLRVMCGRLPFGKD